MAQEPTLFDRSNSQTIQYITVISTDGGTAQVQLGGYGPKVGDYLGLTHGVAPGWWQVVTAESSRHGTATDPIWHMGLRRHIPKHEKEG